MTNPLEADPLSAEPETEATVYQIPPECAVVIPPRAQELLVNLHARLEMVRKHADELIIHDAETNQVASAKLAILTQSKKQLETKLKELRTPLNSQLKLISMPFNILLDQIKPINTTLGRKVMRYQDEVDAREKARQEDEQRRAAEALRAQQAEIDEQAEMSDSPLARQDSEDIAQEIKDIETVPVKVQATRTSTLAGTVGRQKRWTYEVIELKKVPRKYLAMVVKEPKAGLQVGWLDSGHRLVMAEVNKGVREIPGLRIYQKSSIAIR